MLPCFSSAALFFSGRNQRGCAVCVKCRRAMPPHPGRSAKVNADNFVEGTDRGGKSRQQCRHPSDHICLWQDFNTSLRRCICHVSPVLKNPGKNAFHSTQAVVADQKWSKFGFSAGHIAFFFKALLSVCVCACV